MKRFSGILQFTIGFFLGLLIFVGGISLLFYFVFSRLAATPEKPVFPEEIKKPKPAPSPKTEPPKTAASPETSPDKKPTPSPTSTVSPSPSASPKSSPSPEPSPSPSTEAEEKLPPGAYKATVIRSEGLSLRADPSREAERVGGVDYNANLIVLETQGEWVRVKVPGSEQTGWVRSGNLKKEE